MKKIGAFPSQDLFSCAVVGDSGEPSSSLQTCVVAACFDHSAISQVLEERESNPTHIYDRYSNIIIVYVVSRIIQCTGLVFPLQELQINRHRFYPITTTHI